MSSQISPKKAAGYARFSTQKQDGGVTIESQDHEMRKTADDKRWLYVRTYRDEAVSGAVPPAERPGMTEMLDDARSRAFEVLLVLDASRLARDQRIFWDTIGDLKDLGVEVFTCVLPNAGSFSPEFELVAGALQGAASYERRLVSLKTKLAHAELQEQGKAHGRPRYGFRINDAGYFEPEGVGVEGLQLLESNPKLKASILAKSLGLEYQEGWALLKNLRLFQSEELRRMKG